MDRTVSGDVEGTYLIDRTSDSCSFGLGECLKGEVKLLPKQQSVSPDFKSSPSTLLARLLTKH